MSKDVRQGDPFLIVWLTLAGVLGVLGAVGAGFLEWLTHQVVPQAILVGGGAFITTFCFVTGVVLLCRKWSSDRR